MSQVVTLYKDKEKTDALYPRTKVSAISDDNNTSLQELLNRYEIIDNLTSYDTDKALSANQGRELNDNFKNYYDKTEVNDLLDNIDVAGMVKQEEGGTVEEIVTPTNADTLGGKLTANNVVFYEEETVDEFGQVVVKNADKLENHPASYYATSEGLNTKANKSEVDSAIEELNTAIANINPLIAYPVGSVYFSVNDTNPSTLFGGTWEQVAQGRALFGAGTLNDITYTADSTIDAGLPNITGSSSFFQKDYGYEDNSNYSGALYQGAARTGATDSGSGSDYCATIALDASRCNSIYGNSATVQPNAFVVYMWKRIS